MKQFKIGLQLYGIRDALERDFDGALKAVKEMGYDYVEYAGGDYGRSWEEIRKSLDAYGLSCISVHQFLDTFLNEPEESLNQVRALGAKYCAICKHNLNNYTDRWEETMGDFQRWGRGMQEAGIKGLYHNHAFEFESIDGEYILDKIFRTVANGLVSPELDVAWIHYGGVDPAEYVKKYAGKIDIVHLKDFACANLPNEPVFKLVEKHGRGIIPPTRKEAGFRYLPVGSGIQDWTAILDACEAAGAEYLVVEQDESRDCGQLEAAKKSIDYLKSILS